MKMESLQQKLKTLSCHFTWDVLKEGNNPTSEMMDAEYDEDFDEATGSTSIQWLNLRGFYKTKEKEFEQARLAFERALENCTSDDQKAVTISCIAWLAHEEAAESHDEEEKRRLEDKSNENFEKIEAIRYGREMEDLPEVLFEKAFAIASVHRGPDRYKEQIEEANRLIDKALERKPDEVMFKFTNAKNTQKLLLYKKKAPVTDDSDAKKLRKLWEDLIENSRDSNLHAQVLAHYACLLNKINRDFGRSGAQYAVEAERYASGNDNPAVLRKIAQFYIDSAGNDTSKLTKAIKILKKILEKSPNCYKTQAFLGNALLKKYSHLKPKTSHFNENIFLEAEKKLNFSWRINKQFLSPALDLARLYQTKYSYTKNIDLLIQAEKLCLEMFELMEELNTTFRGGLCNIYAQFLKNFAGVVAKQRVASMNGCHCLTSSYEQMKEQIQEAFQKADEFEESQNEALLDEAETLFRSLYATIEDKDDVKAAFYLEYGRFMDKYSRDLAMYYFKTSLEYNRHQSPEYTYKPLEELAEEKIESQNEGERLKGHTVLGWMYKLRYETRGEESYLSEALQQYEAALEIRDDVEIAQVIEQLKGLE